MAVDRGGLFEFFLFCLFCLSVCLFGWLVGWVGVWVVVCLDRLGFEAKQAKQIWRNEWKTWEGKVEIEVEGEIELTRTRPDQTKSSQIWSGQVRLCQIRWK
jgi:hypothetical protein